MPLCKCLHSLFVCPTKPFLELTCSAASVTLGFTPAAETTCLGQRAPGTGPSRSVETWQALILLCFLHFRDTPSAHLQRCLSHFRVHTPRLRRGALRKELKEESQSGADGHSWRYLFFTPEILLQLTCSAASVTLGFTPPV